ncbi:thioredoxin family protein [Phaeodactylibacter luteus]|nr:thioredoxin fold domain-containing protein [Phaeodactylibacter luteus]
MHWLLRLLTFTAALMAIGPLSGQGIEFFHGTWEEALEKAAAEEKVIFVDAFAEWCGPCKRMAREVFPREDVGGFFNRHFVNMKIDMEKGMGLDFAKKYPVSAYPTLFFIDAKGEIVQQVKGAQQPQGLLDIGQRILEKTDRSEEYTAQYEAGERSPEFMLKYIKALNRAGKSSLRPANLYFDEKPDMGNAINQRILLASVTEADSRLFGTLIRYRPELEKLVGAAEVARQIRSACEATAAKAAEFKSESLLEEAQEKMKAHAAAGAEAFEYESSMQFLAAVGDTKAYAKTCKKYARKILDGQAEPLSQLATDMIKRFNADSDVLDEATAIAGEAAALAPGNYQYQLLHSKTLLLNGKKEEALAAAQKALELARSESPLAVRTVELYIKQIQS